VSGEWKEAGRAWQRVGSDRKLVGGCAYVLVQVVGCLSVEIVWYKCRDMDERKGWQARGAIDIWGARDVAGTSLGVSAVAKRWRKR